MWGDNPEFDYEDDFDSPTKLQNRTVKQSMQSTVEQNLKIINEIQINLNINGVGETSTVQANYTKGMTTTDEVMKAVTKAAIDVGAQQGDPVGDILQIVTETTGGVLDRKESQEESESGQAVIIIICIVGCVLICVIVVAAYLCYRNKGVNGAVRKRRKGGAQGGVCGTVSRWFQVRKRKKGEYKN